jgi:hypothetical protein
LAAAVAIRVVTINGGPVAIVKKSMAPVVRLKMASVPGLLAMAALRIPRFIVVTIDGGAVAVSKTARPRIAPEPGLLTMPALRIPRFIVVTIDGGPVAVAGKAIATGVGTAPRGVLGRGRSGRYQADGDQSGDKTQADDNASHDCLLLGKRPERPIRFPPRFYLPPNRNFYQPAWVWPLQKVPREMISP